MYQFLSNMWIVGKIYETYLAKMVEKGYITAEEKELILATPQK